MKAFNDKCKLNGYEDTVDWYPAWETYKFLYRNEELRTEKYEDLHDAAEYIIVSHQLSKDMRKSYLDVSDFYRFYVKQRNIEVLSDTVEQGSIFFFDFKLLKAHSLRLLLFILR